MRGLNRIFKDCDKIRDKFLEMNPEHKIDINMIFNGIMEAYEMMNYENKRGNTKRLNLNNNEDVPVESLIIILDEMLREIKTANRDDFVTFISVLEAKLQQIEGDLKISLRSINKILKKEP